MEIFPLHAATTRTHVAINELYTSDTVIKPVGIGGTIDKLTLTGEVRKLAPNFLVRVVLTTTDDKEYLIMELYDALCSTQTRSFIDYAEETELMNHALADSIKIYLHNANLSIHSFHKTIFTGNQYPSSEDPDSLLLRRVKAKVDTINVINQHTGKLWRAGVTDLSLKDLATKKRILNLKDGDSSYGMEYYEGGLFEMNSDSVPIEYIDEDPEYISPYISDFDWRNHHGINWISPVRDQMNSRSCVAFATTGCIESMMNLYYNDTLNFHLSEQQVASCSGQGNTYSENGMVISTTLNYIKNHGVFDADSYPFTDYYQECLSDSITPNYVVSISSFSEVPDTLQEDTRYDKIKYAIINYGPLVSGFKWNSGGGHAAVLVGYGKLKAGDIFTYFSGNSITNDTIVVQEGDERIGQTYWIFKNSYGKRTSWNRNNEGYLYMLFKNIQRSLVWPYRINPPIYSTNVSFSERKIEDKDRDGYYNWGIGPKPQQLPSWVPDTPDGDDSNPLLGPMNEFGYLENINPEERDTIYYNNKIGGFTTCYHNHIVINKNGLWVITNDQYFCSGSTVTLRNNSTLRIMSGAVLSNLSVIKMEEGSKIILEGDGTIITDKDSGFIVPMGSGFKLTKGSVK